MYKITVIRKLSFRQSEGERKREKKYRHDSRNHDRKIDISPRRIARADKLRARLPPRVRGGANKEPNAPLFYRLRGCTIALVSARVWYRRGGDSGGRRYRDKREKRGAFFGVDAPLFSSAWKGRAASPCTAPRVHAGWVSQSRPLPLRFSACILAYTRAHTEWRDTLGNRVTHYGCFSFRPFNFRRNRSTDPFLRFRAFNFIVFGFYSLILKGKEKTCGGFFRIFERVYINLHFNDKLKILGKARSFGLLYEK